MKRRSFLAALFAAPTIPAALKANEVSVDTGGTERRTVHAIEAERMVMPPTSSGYPFIFEDGELLVNSGRLRTSNGRTVLVFDAGCFRIT